MVLKGLNFLWQGGARVDATRRPLSPDLRLRLKQRQEAAIQEKLVEKRQEWSTWEQRMELEEESKRRQMTERMKVRDEEDFNESRRRALAIQKSERARTVKENKLDDLRSDLQARIQQRRQRSDRWVPPEYAQVVNEKAQQAVKAMRLRKEKEREIRKQREMAAAASFLEGRVRQKVSRFSRVVEDIQSAQQQRGTAEISDSWGPKTPRSRERVGRTVVVEAGLPRKGSSSRFMAADRGDVYVLNRQRPDDRTVDGGGDREHPSSQRTVFVEREADLEAYAPNPEPGLSGRSPSTTVYITPDDILNEDW